MAMFGKPDKRLIEQARLEHTRHERDVAMLEEEQKLHVQKRNDFSDLQRLFSLCDTSDMAAKVSDAYQTARNNGYLHDETIKKIKEQIERERQHKKQALNPSGSAGSAGGVGDPYGSTFAHDQIARANDAKKKAEFLKMMQDLYGKTPAGELGVFPHEVEAKKMDAGNFRQDPIAQEVYTHTGKAPQCVYLSATEGHNLEMHIGAGHFWFTITDDNGNSMRVRLPRSEFERLTRAEEESKVKS